MFTSFQIYCCVCGKKFEVTAGGGGYGRKVKCCGEECHNKWEKWYTLSIMGKQIDQEEVSLKDCKGE